jgi:hypothetical protein
MPLFRELATRGIPGVQSDTYHFGFFEDVTLHRLDPVAHNEYDSLLQTLKIFVVMLLGYSLLSFIVFGVREYTWSLKERRQLLSNGSVWSNHSIPLDSRENQQLQLRQLNRAYPEINLSPELKSISDNDSSHGSDPNEEPRLDIVPLSPSYSATSLKDWITKKAQTGTLNKLIYSKEELLSLKPFEFNGVPLLDVELLKANTIELAIASSFQDFQQVGFKSATVAERTIRDICLNMTISHSKVPSVQSDLLDRKVSVMRLLAIAANPCSMENGNIFLPAFNDAMDFLIDTGAVFELLSETNVYLARGLVDMVIQYCYAHWLFADARDPKVLEQFRVIWKYPDPIAQNHSVITRYLLNLQLGLYTVKDHLDDGTLLMTISKSRTLLRHIAQQSNHSDPVGMIPILRKAIEYTEIVEMQIFYYSLVLIIVQLHADRTILKMLRNHDENLKYLVQMGLWTQNPQPIRIKTEKIFQVLVKMIPSVQMWWDEVKGGSISICETALPIETAGEERPMRPGSFRLSASQKRR